ELEARVASRLKHPNVVTVHDFGRTPEGLVYLVLEWLEGASIREALIAEKSFPLPRALAITEQIARALCAAKPLGIIHRDLKPENVYLTHPGGSGELAKILDFGIAKATWRDANITGDHVALGTPRYMSPEQVLGEQADHRCDQYAAGLLLYEMLAGRP